MDRRELEQWVEKHQAELVSDLQRLLRIPSVRDDETRTQSAPFGKEVRDALDLVLDTGRRHGIIVRDFDGYACDLTIGEGGELVVSLCHVDVVPPGDGWSYPPFGAEIHNGYIYARGSTDNKGATVASVYALRALRDLGCSLKRRIRLIVGCDEENRWECIRYYKKQEPERPVWGVSPDADWSVVFAEKGILNLRVEKEIEARQGIRVRSASGGKQHNMVPDRAEAIVAEQSEQLVGGGTEQYRHTIAKGKSAHASRPEAGVNAIALLLKSVEVLNPVDNELWLQAVRRWASTTDGETLDIKLTDDVSGELTCNLGILDYDGVTVQCVFDIRYPVSSSIEQVLTRLLPQIQAAGFHLREIHHKPPLYVPLNTPFLECILEIYRDEVGENVQPVAIGGGTYARSFPGKIVAIGAALEGDGKPHEANERISIATLKKLVVHYARVYQRLANLNL